MKLEQIVKRLIEIQEFKESIDSIETNPRGWYR